MSSEILKLTYRNYTASLLVITFTLFFSSCKKENRCDCIKRTGDIISVVRSVKTFDRLLVEQNVNVIIIQDVVQEVKVEAGENIEPLIETVVVDGTLIIRNKNRCNWTRSYNKPLNVYLKTPGIKYLTSNGTGTIKTLNTITLDTFDVEIKNSGNIEMTVNNSRVISHVYGAGDLTLRGATASHSCSIGGSSFLYAADLYTNYTWIQSYTLGTCYVRTDGTLYCRIDDKGDVHCKGSPPNVIKTFNGHGQLFLE